MANKVSTCRPCLTAVPRLLSKCCAPHMVASSGIYPKNKSAGRSRAGLSKLCVGAAAQEVVVGEQGTVVQDYGIVETAGKRLQTIVADVGEDTITIRCLDWDRDRFDIEFGLQNGTTYNSYLIFGTDKTALIDASHEKFRDLYMPVLQEQLESRGRSLDYLFVSHTEPDHSGLVKDVVELYPDVQVLGSKVCIAFLDGLTHIKMNTQVVKGGDKIELGGGHDIEFVMAPNLHWPDTMFTYDHGSQIMFTCDAFGMHYCSEVCFISH